MAESTKIVIKSASGGWKTLIEVGPHHGGHVKVAARLRRLGLKAESADGIWVIVDADEGVKTNKELFSTGK